LPTLGTVSSIVNQSTCGNRGESVKLTVLFTDIACLSQHIGADPALQKVDGRMSHLDTNSREREGVARKEITRGCSVGSTDANYRHAPAPSSDKPAALKLRRLASEIVVRLDTHVARLGPDPR
jgi:hypothetical protein